MINQINSIKNQLEKKARELGFDLFGVASTGDSALEEATRLYDGWLESGYSAQMEYLKKHRDTKTHIELFLKDAKSVICVGLNYATSEKPLPNEESALISQYTRAEDYHELVTGKLNALMSYYIEISKGSARLFVDSAPVMDRFWATRAGLGWPGKNTCLINREVGSYFFIGGFFISQSLEPDSPYTEHCGKCRKCIEACPTEAIKEPDEKIKRHHIDSQKCIAYHTIENKGLIPDDVMKKTGRWVAGCDICQQVCPWNDPIQVSNEFRKKHEAYGQSLATLVDWNKSDFDLKLKGVAMQRMQYSGFLRNLAVAVSNSGLENKEVLFQKIVESAAQIKNEEKKEIVLKTIQSLK